MAEEMINSIFVSTNSQLNSCLDSIKNAKQIALDLEFDKNRLRYGSTLCLMQIYYNDICYLIDPLSKELDLKGIFDVFENPEVLKVVFAFGEDLRLLHLYGCKPNNVFDIATLSRLLDYPALSLTNLLLEKLEVETLYSSQLSDWFKRPLTDKQSNYAAEDVLHLFKLKDALVAEEKYELVKDWFAEESKLIDNFVYDKSVDQEFLKRKDKQKMNEYDWFVFSKLMTWREKTAEEFNRPSHFIMPLELVKEIVENPNMINKWVSLPRMHKRVKNKKYAQIVKNIFENALTEANDLGLDNANKAIDSLSPEQKRLSRESRRENDIAKTEIFKPIQADLAGKIGENATNFIFSNKVIMNVITDNHDDLPNYRKVLILKSAENLNLNIDTYLPKSSLT